MKHFLRTAVVGAAAAIVCIVPAAAARQRSPRERGLVYETESFFLADATFHEDVVTDLADEVETWREEPGAPVEADSEWSWRSEFQP